MLLLFWFVDWTVIWRLSGHAVDVGLQFFELNLVLNWMGISRPKPRLLSGTPAEAIGIHHILFSNSRQTMANNEKISIVNGLRRSIVNAAENFHQIVIMNRNYIQTKQTKTDSNEFWQWKWTHTKSVKINEESISVRANSIIEKPQWFDSVGKKPVWILWRWILGRCDCEFDSIDRNSAMHRHKRAFASNVYAA